MTRARRPLGGERGTSAGGPALGASLAVTLERPAFGGDLLAHAPDGRVVLVEGGAPGDVVEIEVTAVERRFVRGRVVRLVAPSAERAAPFCAIADHCGGCPWHAVPAAVQQAALADHVERALTRAGGPHRVDPIWAAAPGLGWRSTARLQVDGTRIGYFASGTRTLVVPSSCAVLTPEVEALRAHAAGIATALGLSGGGTLRLTARPAGGTGTITLFPRSDARGWSAWAQRLLGGPCHGVRLVPADEGTPIDHGRVEDVLGPANVPHPAGSFVQAHQPGATALQAHVLAWLDLRPGTRVLELYAGSGHFTLALLAAGVSVTAVERDPAAAARLAAEVERRGFAGPGAPAVARVVAGDAAHFPHGQYAAVLVDPPRAGARDVVPALVRLRPSRLVYVSCDPATLARDVAALVAGGARLQRTRAFDLFPHTGHVEVVALLTWDKPGRARA
ncbi:TRAM domain-containing protein [Myxococcota bacterium]|nr:TRAM domain-containing protein [Myxococcota bacterium]